MIKQLFSALAITAVLFMAFIPNAQAAKPLNINFSQSSRIWMEGDSTLHAFKLTSKKFDVRGTLVADGENIEGTNSLDLDISVPVKSLKSGDGTLDTNAYNALNATKFPAILFSANKVKIRSNSNDVDVVVFGKLTIQDAVMPMEIASKGTLNDGKFRLVGKKDLLMTDFGVQPPVLMFGAIKVYNKITIRFDLSGEIE